MKSIPIYIFFCQAGHPGSSLAQSVLSERWHDINLSGQCCQVICQTLCHVLSCQCHNAYKISLTICCRGRASCPVNRPLQTSVCPWITCIWWTGTFVCFKQTIVYHTTFQEWAVNTYNGTSFLSKNKIIYCIAIIQTKQCENMRIASVYVCNSDIHKTFVYNFINVLQKWICCIFEILRHTISRKPLQN